MPPLVAWMSRPGASRPASVPLRPAFRAAVMSCVSQEIVLVISSKSGMWRGSGSAYRSHVDPNQIIVVYTLRSQRAQGHESSLFGTRLFNRWEMVTRDTIDITSPLKGSTMCLACGTCNCQSTRWWWRGVFHVYVFIVALERALWDNDTMNDRAETTHTLITIIHLCHVLLSLVLKIYVALASLRNVYPIATLFFIHAIKNVNSCLSHVPQKPTVAYAHKRTFYF